VRSIQRDGRGETPANVLGRAALILESFDGPTGLSLSELTRRTGLPKSTTHRLVAELVRLRLLDSDGRLITLGTRLAELAELVPRRNTLREAALPAMSDLRDATRLRVDLAVLEGVNTLLVASMDTPDPTAPRRPATLAAHASAAGKALLAYSPTSVVRARIDAGLPRLTPRTITTPGGLTRDLQNVRSSGVAFDREENIVGISSVASAVFGSRRRVTAAVAVTGRTARVDVDRLGTAVHTAALALSRALRGAGL
jgi:DNA-binding IclR family transcriptional regulator